MHASRVGGEASPKAPPSLARVRSSLTHLPHRGAARRHLQLLLLRTRRGALALEERHFALERQAARLALV